MKKEVRTQKLPIAANLKGLIDYIASNNPKGVRKLAYTYGYPNYKTYQGSIRFLEHFLKSEGEKGLDDFIMQHPDRDLILEVYYSKFPQKLQFSSFLEENKNKEVKIEEKQEEETTEDQKALINTLGILVAKRKYQVLKILAKHSEPVNDSDDIKEISDKLIKLITKDDESFNYDLSEEIYRLQNPEYSDFVPIIGAIAKGIGDIAGKIKGNKKEDSQGITLAALNYKINSKTNQPAPKEQGKDQNVWMVMGIMGSVMVLILIIVLVLNK